MFSQFKIWFKKLTTEMHANGPNKIYYIRDYVDE